jgi:hypothetical protein
MVRLVFSIDVNTDSAIVAVLHEYRRTALTVRRIRIVKNESLFHTEDAPGAPEHGPAAAHVTGIASDKHILFDGARQWNADVIV